MMHLILFYGVLLIFCLQNGTLKIIDRKKHIFKLAQGEYVAPEKLENIYVSCPLIAQIFCYGNSNQVHQLSISIKTKLMA